MLSTRESGGFSRHTPLAAASETTGRGGFVLWSATTFDASACATLVAVMTRAS